MPELDSMQRDALREMGNIGAGHALNLLSDCLDRRLEEGLSFADIVSAEMIFMFMGGVKSEMLVAYSPVCGSVPGMFLMIFPAESWRCLAKCGDGVSKLSELGPLERLELSALGEKAAKEYVAALAAFISSELRCYAPVQIASGREMLDLLSRGGYNRVIMLETDFASPDQSVEGDFLFLISVDGMTDDQKSDLVKKIMANCFKGITKPIERMIVSKFYSQLGVKEEQEAADPSFDL